MLLPKRNWFQRRHCGKCARRQRAPLFLEVLEDRSLPAPLTYTSFDTPKNIVDAQTIRSTITISDDFKIADLNVRLEIQHAFNDDLVVLLKGPDGKSVRLFGAVGGSSDDFRNTIFDDEALVPIKDGIAPFAGVYKPANPLSGFDGRAMQGQWTLEITDTFPEDAGVLKGWSLIAEPVQPLFEPEPDLVGAAFLTDIFTQWGVALPLRFAIGNQGAVPAGPFDVQVRLSTDQTIDQNDQLLATIRIDTAAAGTKTWHATEVLLPNSAPNGVSDDTPMVLGLIIDSGDVVLESAEANNRNRGAGFDQQFLFQCEGVLANNVKKFAEPVALNVGLRGSISAPADVDFYRFDITEPGYLSVEVTRRAGSTLDSRLGLHNTDSLLILPDGPIDLRIGGGGLLAHSDDRSATSVDPLLSAQYLLPGTYFFEVAAFDGVGTGAYLLQPHFVADQNNPHDPATNLPSRLQVAENAQAIISADFNRDSVIDLATINQAAAGFSTVSILIGIGDATFEPARHYRVPDSPNALLPVDFNNDGRTDLATLDPALGIVSFLPGIGDGRFTQESDVLRVPESDPGASRLFARPQPLPDQGSLDFVIHVPDGFVIDDVNVSLSISHEDLRQLAVVLISPSFTQIPLFSKPSGIRQDENDPFYGFRNNTFDDEAAKNLSSDIFEFAGFRPQQPLSGLDGENSQGTWVLKVTDAFPNVVGTLEYWSLTINGRSYTSYSATFVNGDFSRDGFTDKVSLEKDAGQGFSALLDLGVGAPTTSEAIVDLGVSPKKEELLSFARSFGLLIPGTEQVSINPLINQDVFLSADRNSSNAARSEPLIADLNGDGIDDVLVMSRAGDILFRRGRGNGEFAAPVLVNDDAGDSQAREIAILNSGASSQIVALDLTGNRASIYTLADGKWDKTKNLDTGFLPLRLDVGDLDADGVNDIAIGNALIGSLSIYLNRGAEFITLPQIKVGISVSDVHLSDVNNDGLLDILVTTLASNDVSVLVNQGPTLGTIAFRPETRFRAGAGPYSLIEAVSSIGNELVFQVTDIADAFAYQYFTYSRDDTGNLAEGDLNGDGIIDVVASNTGSNTFAVLFGKAAADGRATGSFHNARIFNAGLAPSAVVIEDFDKDGHPDLAILNEGDNTIAVFLNRRGDGTFVDTPTQILPAGNAPTGLRAAQLTDDNNDGSIDFRDRLDLLVGNVFGDILILKGHDQGVFEEFKRVGQQTPFVTLDLDGDNVLDVIVANQAQDEVLSFQRVDGEFVNAPNFAVTRLNAQALEGPGAMLLHDMTGDGLLDIIVAESGSNTIRVYRATSRDSWDMVGQTVFAGTSPVGLAAAQLTDDNNDGVINDLDAMDLGVANFGSNDISILLGSGRGSAYQLQLGPRLQVGNGPQSISFSDQTGDGVMDAVVANAGGVALLPAVGNGFFNDAAATFITLPSPPISNIGNQFLTPNAIFSIDFGTGAAVAVFRPSTPMTAFTPISETGGFVVASTKGLTVVVAKPDGQLDATRFFEDAKLNNPSALRMVGDEIYVTNSGDSLPLVFSFADGIPVPGAGTIGERGTSAILSTIGNSAFALAPTLVTEGEFVALADGSDEVSGDQSAELPNAVLVALLVEMLVGPDLPPILPPQVPSDPATQLANFIAGVEDALERIRHEMRTQAEDGVIDIAGLLRLESQDIAALALAMQGHLADAVDALSETMQTMHAVVDAAFQTMNNLQQEEVTIGHGSPANPVKDLPASHAVTLWNLIDCAALATCLTGAMQAYRLSPRSRKNRLSLGG